MDFEYSEKEMALIKYFGFENIASRIVPHQLYGMMAVELLKRREKHDSPASNSVRACIEAMDGPIYRMTPEFDALIEI